MNRLLSLLPLIGVGLLTAPSQDTSQDPPTEKPPSEVHRDIFGRQKLKTLEAGEGIEGMWQLLAVELKGYPAQGLVPSGFLLLSNGFVAFEMHAYYEEDGTDNEPFEDGFQTFFGEYGLVSGQSLVCTSLIGSYLDEGGDGRGLIGSYLGGGEGDLQFEDPGTMREFVVELEDRMLTLRWGDNDSMTFARRRHTMAQLTDIYGKERGQRSLKGPDIFGREKSGEEEGTEGDDG